ncbi:unnamed protein product [Paramecium pentaurelia]|uniref:Uncharacterized protein n=1 Tax=Paramecium pentaurelia TaxID=43138 RepID=A0A8S1TS67_9CILI|nr:unnamed protein product [Paramecium pentaurelia]
MQNPQGLYQTRMSISSNRSNDIDFDKYKQIIETEISNNWLGFKYLNQLEDRKIQIVDKINEYLEKLTNGKQNLIIYCDFKFSQNLDLLIKTSDIRQQFLEQQPPNENMGVKINQPDLYSALLKIREFMFNECMNFKQWLKQYQDSKGDIWNKAEWFLQNNNEKESNKYFVQVEKHRKNMMNQLNFIQENQDYYIELSVYLDHYYEYFDHLNVSQRTQIYLDFIQFLDQIKQQPEIRYKYNQYYKNNAITDRNQKQYIVNQPLQSKYQISIPKFLWFEIQKADLQGFILCKMIESQEFNLNYKVIENIFLKQRDMVFNQPPYKPIGQMYL